MSLFLTKFCWRLDRELTAFFQLPTEERWIVSNDGGKSLCAATNRRDGPWYQKWDLEQWLAEQQAKGYHLDYKLLSSPIYPRVSTDPSEAVLLLQAMEKTKWRVLSAIARRSGDKAPFNRLRWACELRCCSHPKFEFGSRNDCVLGLHHTFAGAVARAAIRLVKILPSVPKRIKS
jgi:hypothetical protein